MNPLRKYATPAEATAAHRAGTKANNARRAEASRGWEPARCKRGCRVPEQGGSKRSAVNMLKHCATCRKVVMTLLDADEWLLPPAEDVPGPWRPQYPNLATWANASGACVGGDGVLVTYNVHKFRSPYEVAELERMKARRLAAK